MREDSSFCPTQLKVWQNHGKKHRNVLHERDFLRYFMIAMQMFMVHADLVKNRGHSARVLLSNTVAFVCQQTSVLKNSKQKRGNSTGITRTGN